MFKPMYEYVLIEKDDAPQTTKSGLVVSTKEDPNAARFGEVVAVGDGYRTDQPESSFASEDTTLDDTYYSVAPGALSRPVCLALRVKPGDRVLFRPRSATVVEYGGESYYLIRESELMGVDSDSAEDDE